MRTCTVESGDAYSLAYDVVGSGSAVVLVPGFMMDRTWWHTAGYVERLSSQFTVISIDPLGHGDSDRPHDPDAYGDARLVDHVVRVLDAEDVERCYLWGSSRGGTMASLATRAHPERVDLAVLGSAPAAGSSFPDEAVDALQAGDWEPFFALLREAIDPSTLEAFAAANDARAMGAILKARGSARWHRFEVPVVGYVGDGEPVRHQVREDAHRLAFPMAVLPTGGHMETFTTIDPPMALVSPFLTP